MKAWDDLTHDEKDEIALIAGFPEETAWSLRIAPWAQLSTAQRKKLSLVNIDYYLSGDKEYAEWQEAGKPGA